MADEGHVLIKQERMADGRTKLIPRERDSGRIVERFKEEQGERRPT
jgi:hypothetical protein